MMGYAAHFPKNQPITVRTAETIATSRLNSAALRLIKPSSLVTTMTDDGKSLARKKYRIPRVTVIASQLAKTGFSRDCPLGRSSSAMLGMLAKMKKIHPIGAVTNQ
jgi:hypothetical protein